jgi:MaoC like domain
MSALSAAKIPSSLSSAIGLFRHRRAGLDDPTRMPRIERSISNARVDSAWLATYCDSVGLHAGDLSGLPPLVLQIAAAPLHLAILADVRFPFRALGLVHLSQQVSQTHVISLGAEIDLLAYTTDARWEKRGISIGLVTEARVDGVLCWQGVTRALAPGKTMLVSPAPTSDANEPSSQARVEEIIEVPENTGRRYAKIAGDLNPIHQHALLAKPFGFKRAIVHGTWTLARALVAAGLPHREQYSFDATFRRPVELPSQISVHAYGDPNSHQQDIFVQNPVNAATHLRIQFHEYTK